jgi:hypothetical protein
MKLSTRIEVEVIRLGKLVRFHLKNRFKDSNRSIQRRTTAKLWPQTTMDRHRLRLLSTRNHRCWRPRTRQNRLSHGSDRPIARRARDPIAACDRQSPPTTAVFDCLPSIATARHHFCSARNTGQITQSRPNRRKNHRG